MEMKEMKMGLKHCRKWAVPLIVMIIINLNLFLSEATSQQGRRMLQMQETTNTVYKPDDTARVDPLDHFQKYRGFDITNKHYWTSTIFTGIYGYTIALLWLVVGAVYSIYLLSTTSCCINRTRRLKNRRSCHKQCYLFPLILATIFALLAIIASGVALGGTMQFHTRAKTIMSIIMETADKASNTIHNATGAMKQISQTLQTTDGADAAAADASVFLTSTSDKLNSEAADIERQAKRNRHLVNKGLTILYILTTVTISLNLVAVIGISVFGILRFEQALHLLIILCWLLTTLCWLLFGAYFFLEKFSGDTCTALQDFQHNPDNSSLSLILPCDELVSARSILSDVGVGIYEIVNQVNANLSLMRSNPFSDLEYICNPFSGPPDYLYQPKDCPEDTIQIKDLAQVLKMFTCSGNSGMSCKQGEFITTSEYNIIQAYTTSIQHLLDAYPEMQALVDCQLVKNAFSEILVNHCKPLKRYIKTTWIATLLLSIMMVVLELLWTNTTRHEQKHHFASGSVKPNNVGPNTPGSQVAKATSHHPVE